MGDKILFFFEHTNKYNKNTLHTFRRGRINLVSIFFEKLKPEWNYSKTISHNLKQYFRIFERPKLVQKLKQRILKLFYLFTFRNN